MPIIALIPRDERRLMQKAIHKTRDKNHARRLTAMLMLQRGDSVSYVARTLCCALSSMGRWINWFTLYGMDGLISLRPGRESIWPFEQIYVLLKQLVSRSPGDFGYQRSRWSTELLTIKINEITGCKLPPGTIRRWQPVAGLVWRRAAPTLHIRDPHKDEKMAAIRKALDKCSIEHPVFYEDEVDIHLNPKIGADWQVRGLQKRVTTPGQNEIYYLAGALHSGTGKISYVGGNSKASSLFISLLSHLKRTYRRAKTITLIVDNYIIHKSEKTRNWLKANPKFNVIYQPVYSLWVNHVERLWQALHDTIPHNHQCRSMVQLLKKVRHFMKTASPFPGRKHGLAKSVAVLGAAI
ncbi:IS630 family transposase [Serratia marcescens]